MSVESCSHLLLGLQMSICWFYLPNIYSPFCWWLLSDIPRGSLCSALLDLGLDEVDFTSDLWAGHVTQVWQGGPHSLPGQYRDACLTLWADVQLLYIGWFKNSAIYTWRTFLVASCKNLPSNIPFIMLSICLFCCCCCCSILENL